MRRTDGSSLTGYRRLGVNAVLLILLFTWFLLSVYARQATQLRPNEEATQITNESLVDCDLVWRTLKNLYEESKLRQAAWKEAGYPLPVTAPPGKNVTEIHLLMVGDSWARFGTHSIIRHLDVCRMRLPQPLLERDECALRYVVKAGGHAFFQFSKAALGWEGGASAEDAGLLRIHVYFQLERYLVLGAQRLSSTLKSAWPMPSTTVHFFPQDAECSSQRFPSHASAGGLMPVCLCEDTLDMDRNTTRRVPVDAVQVFNTMWDTHRPATSTDGFEFTDNRVDWFFRQKRFSPDLSEYPFMTWEDNVARFRKFLAGNYVSLLRGVSSSASTPPGVPMPRVLLSVIPKVNCSAPKFTHFPTLNSSQRCRELAWPLHETVSDAVHAAYGEPLLGFARSVPPEWLRLVDYRPLSATEASAQYTHAGASIAPGEYLCSMSDGAHLDTVDKVSSLTVNVLGCTQRFYALPWRQWCLTDRGHVH